jgi:uncharacterized protein
MSQPGSQPANRHHAINYIEFAATDIAAAKKFYASVFGWSFTDYGPEYASFSASAAGLDGGFYKAEPRASTPATTPLIVIYSTDLAATEAAILAGGGTIVVPTFDFPGGRRFHFADGVGNVLAIWSE